jgi:hypothetical protein
MNELAQALIAESYAAAPSNILGGLTDDLAHRENRPKRQCFTSIIRTI